MSNSEYIGELSSQCLNPILTLLSNSNVWRAPMEYISAVGQAWVQVGLLQLHLTLPQTPVDPATKSAVKARLLTVETNLSKKQMKASHLQAVLSGSSPVTLDMAEISVTIRQTEHQIAVLSARAVQRPSDAPSFDELFSELRGACDGLANIERTITLVKKAMDSFTILQQAIHAWSHATNSLSTSSSSAGSAAVKNQTAVVEKAKNSAIAAFDTLSICAREELSWQGSVAAFTERCCLYFYAYEDVYSPILAAMQSLSTGMRLSVGRCFGEAEDLILALSQYQASSKRSHALVIRNSTEGMSTTRTVTSSTAAPSEYSATEVMAGGWRGVLGYPHSSSISLRGPKGEHVSADAISQVHSALQCSELLAARAFRAISDMRAAQGEQSVAAKSRVAPNPLLVEKICPQAALLLSLARLDYLVGGGTATCSSAKGLFRQVLERFVHAYLRAEDDRKVQAALKAALYQNKAQEKVFESDDVKEELVALRLNTL